MHYRSICLLVCASALPAIAADVVRGVVQDRSGAVIAGASVQVLTDGRAIAATKSGADGAFSITLPRAGTDYEVLAAASSFSPASSPLRAGAPVVLVLDVAPYRESAEIRAAMPPNEDVLDLSGVRESTAKDPSEALTALDGVWKIRKAGIANDLVVRGFQQNNINVLVDGARIYGACPSHMDPPAQHVDFAEVDRIEVSKGAFDVTHQGSLGALVNIVTKDPGMGFHLRPSFGTGSFGYYNPSVTASYGNSVFRVLGGYSYRASDPYRHGLGRPFTTYANYRAAGRSFDINTGWMEALLTLPGRQQIAFGYTRQQAGRILYPYLSMDADSDDADRATVRYSSRRIRAEGYFTRVKHFMSDSQRTSAMMGTWMMASDASTRAAGGRVEADLGRDWTAGVESYDRNWNLLGYMRMGGMMTVNPSIPNVGTRAAGAYVNYRRALTERLRLTAGARFDHAEMNGSNIDNYPSGNARMSYSLQRSMELFAGVGSTGRIPDAEERYIHRGMGAGGFVGDPRLPVTRNTEVTGGWSLHASRFTLRPSVFHSFLEDYIVVNRMAGMRSYTNVAARIYGGEMAYNAAIGGAWSLSGGASYSRGTATPKPGANVLSRNLAEMPPLRGWSALRYVRRWAYAELNATAVNRQGHVSSDLNEAQTPGYAVMGFKLGATYGKVSGSFAVDNLLNRFYYEHLSYYRDPFAAGVKVPEPGRNFFLQVRYSL